jgi:hypothetical protein
MDAGFGRGGIDAGLGRDPGPDCRGAPVLIPNGLLPPLRPGGRPGRGPAAAGRGGVGTAAGPGPGTGRAPGAGAPGPGGSRRVVSRCRAACWAALTWASCSALSVAARASAAATSMSWALACAITGAVGRGGPGTGPFFTGAVRLGGVGFAATAGASTATGGATAATGAAGAADASRAARSRRATGASTVLDADFTNSPSSLSLARTTLLSTPSSFASSCTRALPATELLTPRPGGNPRADLTRALEA